MAIQREDRADLFAVDKQGDVCIGWGIFEGPPEAIIVQENRKLAFTATGIEGCALCPQRLFSLQQAYLTLIPGCFNDSITGTFSRFSFVLN